MPSTASKTTSALAASARYDYDWSRPARYGFQVFIAWNCINGGSGAAGIVRDTRGGPSHAFSLDLAEAPASQMVALVHVDGAGQTSAIDVTVSLEQNGDLVSLQCNLPIAVNEFFFDAIGAWPRAPGPSPSPYPDPDPDGDTEFVIEAPGEATDLVSFIWLRPLSAAESADAALRFVTCQIAAMRALYASCDTAQKISKASEFIAGPDFVKDIAGLGPSIALFPAARLQFMALPGEQTNGELVEAAQKDLSIESLPAFLQDPACAAALLRVWQSIFALALVDQPQYALVANQLPDILRVFHYLELVNQGAAALTDAHGRQLALTAMVAVPDDVAALPPDPTIAGAGAGAKVPPDSWEVLGIGKLKMARQHLAGYAPGELADVVNVMPRERQELLERTVTTTTERSGDASKQHRQNDTSRATSAASELADTIHEVMAADGMAVNMSSVTPEYGNLNMLLTGSGSNSKARSGWSSADTSRMVQRLTEHAAMRLGDRISSQRGREWQELRERRQSQLIDNRGNERLVGVYRWVDRVVRVHVEELGSRMVLAFDIEQPAKEWVAAVAAQGSMPLVAPPALPATCADVLPSTYQALGAQYGLLALEPPPPAQLVLSTAISRVTLGDLSLLCVPDGYAVTNAAVTLALSDASYNLACSVGGSDVPATKGSASLPLSAAVPVCSAGGAGPALVAPPNQPVSVSSTVTLSKLQVSTGRIPITVMSAAPLFCVTVTLTCALDAHSSLLSGWQMRTYAALQGAWQSAWQTYDTALGARVALASDGHGGEVQRDTLKHACLGLLLHVAGTPATTQRALEPLLDWTHMTWQYQSPTSASGNNWPQNPSAEATRPSSDRLFQRFLTAQAARVLLPVSAGWESALLFYLQFQHLWSAGPARAPVTESTLPLIEELLRPDIGTKADGGEAAVQLVPPPSWTVRVPTSMIYLQNGAELPHMQRCLAARLEA